MCWPNSQAETSTACMAEASCVLSGSELEASVKCSGGGHLPCSCCSVTCLIMWSIYHIVTYSGFSIHDVTLLHSKSQYTTVKHSRQLLEHTYTSDPHGLGTPTPIVFFQQDLLWHSSNTRSHSCSQKAFKHTSGQSIVGLSVRLHTTTAPWRIVHH
jgi:hypothetical protein